MADAVELVYDYPSNIAAALLSGQIDIGLVPVAVIPAMSESHIIPGYCIGAEGEVASVALFSDVPLQEISSILLDYQSRTSVALLKLLLEKHWKLSPQLIDGGADYEKNIQGTTAGLVIGDRAFAQRHRSKYIYDLGLAWKEMTGLPFVFAAWVSNRPLSEDFMQAFAAATGFGVNDLEAVLAQTSYDGYDLHKYYTKNISYQLDAAKMQGLQLFLGSISQSGR